MLRNVELPHELDSETRAENELRRLRSERAAAYKKRRDVRRGYLWGAVAMTIICTQLGNWMYDVIGAIAGAAVAIVVAIDHIAGIYETSNEDLRRELAFLDEEEKRAQGVLVAKHFGPGGSGQST